MILARSAQGMIVLLGGYPPFSREAYLLVPKTLLRALKPPSVKMTNLPRCPPGASWRILSLWTWQVSSGSLQFIISFIVNDKWSLSQDVSGVSEFTLTGSGVSGFSDFVKIVSDTE